MEEEQEEELPYDDPGQQAMPQTVNNERPRTRLEPTCGEPAQDTAI